MRDLLPLTFLDEVYWIALVAALAWAVVRYPRHILAVSRTAPGLLQVGIEVAIVSALGILFPIVVLTDVKEAGGILSAIFWTVVGLVILGAPLLVGLRTPARRTGAYALVQGVIASFFFFIPLLFAAFVHDSTPPPPGSFREGPGGFLPLVAIMVIVWPVFPLVTIGAGKWKELSLRHSRSAPSNSKSKE